MLSPRFSRPVRAGDTSYSFATRWVFASALAVALLLSTGRAFAQLPAGPWTVGQTFTNPVTSASTTVSGFINDPAGTPTAGTVSFVRSADGYVFLVKHLGAIVYNNDTPPVAFQIITEDTTAHTVE